MKRRNFLKCIAAIPVLKTIPAPIVKPMRTGFYGYQEMGCAVIDKRAMELFAVEMSTPLRKPLMSKDAIENIFQTETLPSPDFPLVS